MNTNFDRRTHHERRREENADASRIGEQQLGESTLVDLRQGT